MRRHGANDKKGGQSHAEAHFVLLATPEFDSLLATKSQLKLTPAQVEYELGS